MNRREFLLSGTFFLAGAGASVASQNEDDITYRLAREGFRITKRKRTWLGRIKIQATKGRKLREVVLDPSTGEVLRDYTEELSNGQSSAQRRASRRDDNGRSAGADAADKDDSGSGGSGGSGSGGSGGSETGGGGSGSGGEPGGETGGGEPGGETEDRSETEERSGTESAEREKTESGKRDRKGRREGRDVEK